MGKPQIISGKTILLNTKSNCTFIASDLEASIPNYLERENDWHIEWAGELTIGVTEKEYRKIAEELWRLLDDIDTASDMFKPQLKDPMTVLNYLTFIKSKHEKRWNILTSSENDPNKLVINATYPKV